MSLSILAFVLIYGDVPKRKRLIRTGLTLLILIVPYFVFGKAVLHLRNHYHAKYQKPDTPENYEGAYHLPWHGVYCGLGDFGQDKGFKWLDSNAIQYADSVKPGIKTTDEGYDAILRNKALLTICKHPFWYAKILLLRIKRLFWECNYINNSIFQSDSGAINSLLRFVFRISLFVFIAVAIRFRKYRELKMYLFFIPAIFTGLFITTAAGMRYYFGALVLYYMPLAFLASFVFQMVMDRFPRLRTSQDMSL
ncbi:hypothetical protein ACFL3G_02075 [Planctomycetota bacterium]